ncbi:hypothetical protein AZH53_09335 [Methanomicrobiaceae archaeon CYW5]|uniref:hypothetical protein n=1 Tax=Methanovulcanius yangii TaxID=1789227 RepID=UPI0029C9BE67|nr:hypothetical protein [Methanovulcanius yangii]MBT8508606.1 hypothetical protein [Methanovulcanius yangii]
MKPAATTIKVTRELKDRLDRCKVHPREPYNDVIARILDEREGEMVYAAGTVPASGPSGGFNPAVCYRLPDEK